MNRQAGRSNKGKRVALVGLGNIGSQSVPLVARMPEVSGIDLIDPDDYDDGNIVTQNISLAERGKPKVDVQAEHVRSIREDIEVRAFRERVEDVPMGVLRDADVVLAGLDSLAARQRVGQMCFRVGTPLVDAGVEADQMLARVEVYDPHPGKPCIECSWETEYDSLEHTYPCGKRSGPVATNAPALLGAAAAAIQSAECEKLLNGSVGDAAVGKQVLLNLARHDLLVTTYVRSPRCRFDHKRWEIVDLDSDLLPVTMREVFADLRKRVDLGDDISISVERKPFVRTLVCSRCGARQETLHLHGRLGAEEMTCGCGAALGALGFDQLERLAARHIPAGSSSLTPGDIGFRRGDVLTVHGGADRTGAGASEVHFLI